jgi:hypothetical protein
MASVLAVGTEVEVIQTTAPDGAVAVLLPAVVESAAVAPLSTLEMPAVNETAPQPSAVVVPSDDELDATELDAAKLTRRSCTAIRWRWSCTRYARRWWRPSRTGS